MINKKSFKIILVIILLIIILLVFDYLRYYLNFFNNPNIDCRLNQNDRFGFYKTEKNACYGYSVIGTFSVGAENMAVSIKGADLSSFEGINDEYAKDKNNIYYFYTTCDRCPSGRGVSIKKIENVNLDSFQVLSDIYAKDKNHIYKNGEVLKGVDSETFVIPREDSTSL